MIALACVCISTSTAMAGTEPTENSRNAMESIIKAFAGADAVSAVADTVLVTAGATAPPLEESAYRETLLSAYDFGCLAAEGEDIAANLEALSQRIHAATDRVVSICGTIGDSLAMRGPTRDEPSVQEPHAGEVHPDPDEHPGEGGDVPPPDAGASAPEQRVSQADLPRPAPIPRMESATPIGLTWAEVHHLADSSEVIESPSQDAWAAFELRLQLLESRMWALEQSVQLDQVNLGSR